MWVIRPRFDIRWMNECGNSHWAHSWNVLKITFSVFRSLQQWISFEFDEPKICCNSNNNTGHFKPFSWPDQDTYEWIYRKIISNQRAERVSAPILGKGKCVCCVCGYNQWMNERSNGHYYNLRRETNERKTEKETVRSTRSVCCAVYFRFTWRWSAHILRLNWQMITAVTVVVVVAFVAITTDTHRM